MAKKIFSTFAAILVTSLLVSCGGGGGGATPPPTAKVSCVSPQVPNNAGNTCVEPALLSAKAVLLPDLRSIYSSLCGPGGEGNVILSKPIIIDLNRDGRKDIVATLFCVQPTNGIVTTAPVVNRLFAFLQQPDGTFINSTKDLFGTDIVELNGASGNAVTYDFNGDGYEDIAFATSPEDGRLITDNSSNIQSSYMMSLGNGKYSIGQFGRYQWGYSIQLMDNEVGKKDVVQTPIGYGPGSDAWRYDNAWIQLPSDYSWASPNSIFFKRRAITESSHIAIADIAINGTLGFALYTRSNNTDWARTSSLSFGDLTMVPYTSWNSSKGFIPLINMNGQDYVMPYIDQLCELKIRPYEESIAIASFGAYKLPTALYDGSPLVEGLNMTWDSSLIGMSVANGKLTRINLSVKNEVTNFNSYHVSCGDVNGDGYDDIVVEPRVMGNTGVNPMIYLNDKAGGFSLVDPSNFPSASAVNVDTSSMFVDIDGDGISDLMYWAVNGVHPNDTSPVQFQIFKGLRNINALDLK